MPAALRRAGKKLVRPGDTVRQFEELFSFLSGVVAAIPRRGEAPVVWMEHNMVEPQFVGLVDEPEHHIVHRWLPPWSNRCSTEYHRW
jgi:hypothetical protein